jgi:hypothetical protein
MKQFQNKPRHQGTTSINTNQYQMNVEVNEGQVKGYIYIYWIENYHIYIGSWR